MGLECIWEQGIGSAKSRTLLIAGVALSLDIIFTNNIVQNVNVTFPESNISVMKHVDKLSAVLVKDLKLQPDQNPLTKTLGAFAGNLEYLAMIDKLSVLPMLNLHEAICGLYESLEKLYKWDLEKLRQDPAMSGKSEDALISMAQCTRHGLPTMHSRNRLGLSLDYWQERRLVRPTSDNSRDYAQINEKIWGFLINCAPMAAFVAYQSVRVSDKWISDDVEKLSPTDTDLLTAGTGPILDWLEPKEVILPSDDPSKPGDDLLPPKLPEVIFSAKFDPPVTVPLNILLQIYQYVGLTPEPEFAPVTFDALGFPLPAGTTHDPSEARTITRTREVLARAKDGTEYQKTYATSLYIYKPVYGRALEELPFSHPSQLVRMLPTLRQYAFLSTILEKTFNTKMEEIMPEPPPRKTVLTTKTVNDEYESFMANTNGNHEETSAATGHARKDDLGVVLTAHPVPRLQVSFPFRGGNADVTLEVRLNGMVHVISQNIIDEGDDSKGKGRHMTPQDLGRLLEVCEDLGQWCEWIRTRL
jgi:hypothetical protein